jgi:flavodoxin
MNSLVIFDTAFQNTARVARAIAAALQPFGSARLELAAELDRIEVGAVDLLVIGSPTQYHRATSTLQALLDPLDRRALQGVAVACFDTRHRMVSLLAGSAAARLARTLRSKGAHLVVPPVSFFVASREGPLEDEELSRAEDWAREVAKKVIS